MYANLTAIYPDYIIRDEGLDAIVTMRPSEIYGESLAEAKAQNRVMSDPKEVVYKLQDAIAKMDAAESHLAHSDNLKRSQSRGDYTTTGRKILESYLHPLNPLSRVAHALAWRFMPALEMTTEFVGHPQIYEHAKKRIAEWLKRADVVSEALAEIDPKFVIRLPFNHKVRPILDEAWDIVHENLLKLCSVSPESTPNFASCDLKNAQYAKAKLPGLVVTSKKQYP